MSIVEAFHLVCSIPILLELRSLLSTMGAVDVDSEMRGFLHSSVLHIFREHEELVCWCAAHEVRGFCSLSMLPIFRPHGELFDAPRCFLSSGKRGALMLLGVAYLLAIRRVLVLLGVAYLRATRGVSILVLLGVAFLQATRRVLVLVLLGVAYLQTTQGALFFVLLGVTYLRAT